MQYDYEHHSLTSPSDALLTSHGFSGCHLTSNTPRPSVIRWPRRILSGTISGFCMRSV